jgi:hypothetical protein
MFLARRPRPGATLMRLFRDERKERLSNDMAAKQKKRTDNIAMRNERRNDKRKGKSRPGFEGKSLGSKKRTAGGGKR